MADDSMPPKPKTFYNFEFPSSLDADESNSDNESITSNQVAKDECHGAKQSASHSEALQELNDDSLLDQSQVDAQSGSLFSGGKKSPRRLEPDDDATHYKAKKPRPSLFGGGLLLNKSDDMDFAGEELDYPTPTTPGYSLGNGPHTLDLTLEERESSPSEHSLKLGFGLDSSDGEHPSRGASPSPAPSEESVIIPPDDQPVYDLRQNIERRKAFTYIDTDKSGNYDPRVELKERMARLHRAKAAKASKASKSKKNKKKSKSRGSKKRVKKCIIKLRFKAYGNVRNIINDEDYWPDDWSVLSSDEEREIEERRSFRRRNTPGRQIQSPIADPCGDLDDLTGHPAARGCKFCRGFRLPCSLTKSDTYPCADCIDEGTVCELLMPPTEKVFCKQCFEDNQAYCSFQNDPDQAVCDYCVEKDSICVALPPRGYKTRKVDIDELIYGKDRPFMDCTNCRTQGRRCSLKKASDKPPCKACKRRNAGCTFFEIKKLELLNKVDKGKGKAPVDKGKGKAPVATELPKFQRPEETIYSHSKYFTTEDSLDLEDSEQEIQSRESTPEMEMDDSIGRKGMLTKIRTAFAHPIEFGARDPDCSFCASPAFGFIGHFEREVHVIRWHNGLGYTELGGGYHEEKGQTTMCNECTIARLQQLLCPGHEILQIPEDSIIGDFDAAIDDLTSEELGPQEVRQKLLRWCSMCFSVAAHACFCPQPSLYGKEQVFIEGCGMKFCNQCEMRLREDYVGDVNLMATEMEKLPKLTRDEGAEDNIEGKARADVCFLRQGNLLLRVMESD